MRQSAGRRKSSPNKHSVARYDEMKYDQTTNCIQILQSWASGETKERSIASPAAARGTFALKCCWNVCLFVCFWWSCVDSAEMEGFRRIADDLKWETAKQKSGQVRSELTRRRGLLLMTIIKPRPFFFELRAILKLDQSQRSNRFLDVFATIFALLCNFSKRTLLS